MRPTLSSTPANDYNLLLLASFAVLLSGGELCSTGLQTTIMSGVYIHDDHYENCKTKHRERKVNLAFYCSDLDKVWLLTRHKVNT